MPLKIESSRWYARELVDFADGVPTAGKGLVWDAEGKLVAADVVTDLSGYATTEDVSNAIGAVTYSDVGAAPVSHTHATDDITGLSTAIGSHADVSANTTARHTQGTDTGTTSQTFQIQSGVKLKNISGTLYVRNAADSDDAVIVASYAIVDSVYIRASGGTEAYHWLSFVDANTLQLWNANLVPGTLNLGIINASSAVNAAAITEATKPLRERYTRHYLNLESVDDLLTTGASIGDQATVLTGDANDPIHRYELVGDDLEMPPEQWPDVGQPEGWPSKVIVTAPDNSGLGQFLLPWVTSSYVYADGNTYPGVWFSGSNFIVSADSSLENFATYEPGHAGAWGAPVQQAGSTAGVGATWNHNTVTLTSGDVYASPAANPANWRRIVILDQDGEIKGPILNRLVLDTDDTDVAKVGEIVCVVDDLESPTEVSYRAGDGATLTKDLTQFAGDAEE